MKSVKGWLALGTLFLVVGIIGILFTYSSDYEEIHEGTNLENETFNSVNIDTENAKVDIKPTNDSSAKVELKGEKLKSNKINYQVDVEKDTLFIKLNERQKKLYSFDFGKRTLHLNVYLPEKTYETLKANNGNGLIQMKQLQANEVNAITSNGRLKMEDLNSSRLTLSADNGQITGNNIETENMEAKTNNGKIDLKKIKSDSIRTEADNGKINLEEVTGDIQGITNNGSISLAIHDLERNIDLETDNGVIEINSAKKPENVEFNVNVDNGKIDILGEHGESTVIGSGEHLVKLTANNGKITVE